MLPVKKADIIAGLQTDILRLQGFKRPENSALNFGLGPINQHFPNEVFPTGAIHEFLSSKKEDSAATTGFISGILSTLMGNKGAAVWISTNRKLFPPALATFGIQPDRFIFIDLHKEKHVTWALEEALKCGALSAVIGELHELSFTNSRRLQLAVEQSRVTGFIMHHGNRVNTTACVSRWRISSQASINTDFPGVGFPKWKVELLRIRNGKPGAWNIYWKNGKFWPEIQQSPFTFQWEQRQAG